MSTLAAVIVLLATVGVVCAVINIAYNPEEYEYTDYCRDDSEGGRYGETR